ncbi:PREDICTED: uncharacterized protein LOC106125815 [Papilio xuthus]|uniref:E3 ubiquitin-protein ligase E3D n=1 Tax=Papilio xuthus TaxID=66420 RepID=A0AAJ6ZTB3_PAPXU|nr:PREDICTED: uncharacterized protein LOC106125815 [Papilio xuthus]
MLIKNIFIELRSRLRSCNVYITTSIDLNRNCNLKINIQSNCIVLNYYNDNNYSRRDSLSSIESLSDYSDDEFDDTSIVAIDEFCHIIPNSMSCLKIDKNTISFRVLTQPKNGGNFYTEFLSANNLTDSIKTSELKINLNAENDMKIICANCSNVISIESVKFDRILELPTENIDMSEWFCHGHSHGNTSEPILPVLKQNKNDFLYRLTYFVVNKNLLSEKTNKFNLKRDIYHCNRCLAWLGIKIKDTVKLFNSEIKIQQNSTDSYVFTHNNPTNISIDDFIYTIECMTKESNLGLQYAVMCKIVLECTISITNKQYLLIWVMDKELQVLRNNEVIESEKVTLNSSFLTKILYKVELCLNDEVESWLSDPTVVSTDISKSMFCKGLEHLKSTSQKVPEAFRSSNGYNISYLKV